MKQSQDYIQLHIPENPSTVVLIKKKLLFSSRKERCKGRSPRQFHASLSQAPQSFSSATHIHRFHLLTRKSKHHVHFPDKEKKTINREWGAPHSGKQKHTLANIHLDCTAVSLQRQISYLGTLPPQKEFIVRKSVDQKH